MVERMHSKPVIAHQFVPGISADPWLRYFPATEHPNGNRLFVGQGELDRACGLYCVVMAIMLATGLPRRIAMGLLNDSKAQHSAFKRIAKDMYFAGSSGETLGQMAQALRPGLRYQPLAGSHRAVLQEVLAHIMKGMPVMLAVNDKEERYCHWVLVVGVELVSANSRRTGGTPAALLAVDPRSDQPLLRCFNWRLELSHPRVSARYLRFNDDRGRSRLVTCMEAVALPQTAAGVRNG
jgi:hypothetical protein